MIELPKRKMTSDEFLVWLEDLPAEAGKFELWDGEVVVRHGPGFEEGELAEHWDAKGAMFIALREAIARRPAVLCGCRRPDGSAFSQ